MQLNRRNFLLGGAAAVAVAVVGVPAIALEESPPYLWGDGIHDDTAALQWRVDHAARTDEPVVLHNGYFLVSQPLRISGRGIINGCIFRLKHAGPAVDLVGTNDFTISSCVFAQQGWPLPEWRAA